MSRKLRAVVLTASLIVGSTLSAAAPVANAAPHEQARPRDSALVDAISKTTRGTVWTKTRTIPLAFETYHPQGFARVGDRLFLSSVEILEAPVRYPMPVDGYDRSPGKGRGHVFVLDLNGNLQRDIVLGEGDMYHPGGIDADAKSLYVPVAEYRPNSAALVYKINLRTLAVEKAFTVRDHVGGIVADPVSRHLYGVSWGSRTFYTWTGTGRQLARQPNPSHFIDYQDCAYAAHRAMLCTGLTEFANPAGGRFDLGGIALIDLKSLTVRHEVPFQQYSAAAHVATRNPVHLETEGRTLRLWAAPDDGEEVNGTEILVYESTVV